MAKRKLITSLEILKVLALHKEYAQYDLFKTTGKDYRTVLTHLRNLEKTKLVKLIRREESEKGGKKKKIYAITLEGLIFAFVYPSKLWDNIHETAKNHKDKLLVFKKWAYFKERGLEENIRKGLRLSLDAHYRGVATEFMLGLPMIRSEKTLRKAIDWIALGLFYIGAKNLPDEYSFFPPIWEACKKDKELLEIMQDFIVWRWGEVKEDFERLTRAGKEVGIEL